MPAGNVSLLPTKMKLTPEGKNLSRQGIFPLFPSCSIIIEFATGDFPGIHCRHHFDMD
jgi:hypothetical protein